MAVRWYFRYRYIRANVREGLAERGVDVSRQTVADRAQEFGALLAERGMDVSRQTIAAWVQKFAVRLATAARRYTRPPAKVA